MHILKTDQEIGTASGPFGVGNVITHTDLYKALNLEILKVCKDLPESLKIPATMHLMAGGRQPGRPYDFCGDFPVPLWSILRTIHAEKPGGSTMPPGDSTGSTGCASQPELLKTAITTQAMAFLLHLIDDHLSDGQVPADILLLQLRTVVWNRFHSGVTHLSQQTERPHSTIQRWVDWYFESTYQPAPPRNLDEYLELSSRQMAIWAVAPALLHLGIGGAFEQTERIREFVESVTLAWRLIDDLQDWQEDAQAGQQAALYFHSSPSTQSRLDAVRLEPGSHQRDAALDELSAALEREHIPERAARQALDHLQNATAIARGVGWSSIIADLKRTGESARTWLTAGNDRIDPAHRSPE